MSKQSGLDDYRDSLNTEQTAQWDLVMKYERSIKLCFLVSMAGVVLLVASWAGAAAFWGHWIGLVSAAVTFPAAFIWARANARGDRYKNKRRDYISAIEARMLLRAR